jgi:hypothetical protein
MFTGRSTLPTPPRHTSPYRPQQHRGQPLRLGALGVQIAASFGGRVSLRSDTSCGTREVTCVCSRKVLTLYQPLPLACARFQTGRPGKRKNRLVRLQYIWGACSSNQQLSRVHDAACSMRRRPRVARPSTASSPGQSRGRNYSSLGPLGPTICRCRAGSRRRTASSHGRTSMPRRRGVSST